MTRQPRPVQNPHAARASGDRWLFGYADIVTLLFACFASLYAASPHAGHLDGRGGREAAATVGHYAAGPGGRRTRGRDWRRVVAAGRRDEHERAWARDFAARGRFVPGRACGTLRGGAIGHARSGRPSSRAAEPDPRGRTHRRCADCDVAVCVQLGVVDRACDTGRPVSDRGVRPRSGAVGRRRICGGPAAAAREHGRVTGAQSARGYRRARPGHGPPRGARERFG